MAEFGTLLRGHRERSGRSGKSVAAAAGIDAGYLSRLERGEREPPRRATVEALADALELSTDARAELLVAAGHLPDWLVRLGPLDPTLRLVGQVLTDDALPAARRDSFRQIVALLAEQYRQSDQ